MIKKKAMLTTTIRKKLFTVDEANARLPLLRSIVRDVTDLAAELKELHERLILLQTAGALDAEQEREMNLVMGQLDQKQQVMAGYERELAQLGVELKDAFLGLVDFPATLDGREICLCWKIGEAAVTFWHEADAGFAGRRPLSPSLPIGKRGLA